MRRRWWRMIEGRLSRGPMLFVALKRNSRWANKREYFVRALLFMLTSIYSSLTCAAGDAGEEWRCTELYGSEVLVIAVAHADKQTGQIHVAGVEHQTAFSVEGFDRRWNFGLYKGEYNFSFIIQPSGRAYYLDFSGSESKTAKANQHYSCKKR